MPQTYRRADEMAAIRDRVQARATAWRAGVFRRADLAGWGVDADVIPAMLRRGWWMRLHHGVYADTVTVAAAQSPVDRHRIEAAASVAAIEGPAFLFAVSAAVLHGLPFDRTILGAVHVVRPLGHDSRALRRRISSSQRLDPAIVHLHALGEGDVLHIDGVPTVSRQLAALSTAALSSADWAVISLDSACWQSPAAIDDLARLTDEWARLRGIGTVRRALPLVRTGAQTPLESLSRLRLAATGLPEPRLQAALHDADGLIGFVDMLWDDLGVVGEADGAIKYRIGQVVLDEKLREDRIRALGYLVVRWTWDEILKDPARVAARIRAAAAVQHRHGRRPA